MGGGGMGTRQHLAHSASGLKDEGDVFVGKGMAVT